MREGGWSLQQGNWSGPQGLLWWGEVLREQILVPSLARPFSTINVGGRLLLYKSSQLRGGTAVASLAGGQWAEGDQPDSLPGGPESSSGLPP